MVVTGILKNRFEEIGKESEDSYVLFIHFLVFSCSIMSVDLPKGFLRWKCPFRRLFVVGFKQKEFHDASHLKDFLSLQATHPLLTTAKSTNKPASNYSVTYF